MNIRQISAGETREIRHSVMWPDKDPGFVVIPEDEEGTHFGVFFEEDLVSVVSLFIVGHDARFRKFATKTNYQNLGIGSTLLNFLINHCRKLGLRKLSCHARFEKIDFYEKFGLHTEGEVFEKYSLPYIEMSISLDENIA